MERRTRPRRRFFLFDEQGALEPTQPLQLGSHSENRQVGVVRGNGPPPPPRKSGAKGYGRPFARRYEAVEGLSETKAIDGCLQKGKYLFVHLTNHRFCQSFPCRQTFCDHKTEL